MAAGQRLVSVPSRSRLISQPAYTPSAGVAVCGGVSRFAVGKARLRPRMCPRTTMPSTRCGRPRASAAAATSPATPALAMLIALYWERIARGWFLFSLLLCGVFIGILGRIAWAARDLGIGSGLELSAALFAMTAGFIVVIAGWFKPAWTRACTLAACLVVYAC